MSSPNLSRSNILEKSYEERDGWRMNASRDTEAVRVERCHGWLGKGWREDRMSAREMVGRSLWKVFTRVSASYMCKELILHNICYRHVASNQSGLNQFFKTYQFTYQSNSIIMRSIRAKTWLEPCITMYMYVHRPAYIYISIYWYIYELWAGVIICWCNMQICLDTSAVIVSRAWQGMHLQFMALNLQAWQQSRHLNVWINSNYKICNLYILVVTSCSCLAYSFKYERINFHIIILMHEYVRIAYAIHNFSVRPHIIFSGWKMHADNFAEKVYSCMPSWAHFKDAHVIYNYRDKI